MACDGRNAVVKFSKTILEDVSRRDLTINSMAKNAYTGELVDLFGGQDDIKAKVIRLVGDARKRIDEDQLRALRVFRFLSRFGRSWKIDSDTLGACALTDIGNLSGERIRDELIKMFEGNPTFALYHMPALLKRQIFGDAFIKSGLGGHWHAEDVTVHSMVALATACRLTTDPLVRLAVYLHDIGKTDEENGVQTEYKDGALVKTFIGHEEVGEKMVRDLCNRLKFTNEDKDKVCFIVANHGRLKDSELENTPKALKRMLRHFGDRLMDMFVVNFCDRTANLADDTVSTGWIDYIEQHPLWIQWRNMKEAELKFSLRDLAVNGHDMISEFGLVGKAIGDALDYLFTEVDDGRLPNDRQTLIDTMRKRLQEVEP